LGNVCEVAGLLRLNYDLGLKKLERNLIFKFFGKFYRGFFGWESATQLGNNAKNRSFKGSFCHFSCVMPIFRHFVDYWFWGFALQLKFFRGFSWHCLLYTLFITSFAYDLFSIWKGFESQITLLTCDRIFMLVVLSCVKFRSSYYFIYVVQNIDNFLIRRYHGVFSHIFKKTQLTKHVHSRPGKWCANCKNAKATSV
jgi:hypothetical protein